jgi:hypothetical protein
MNIVLMTPQCRSVSAATRTVSIVHSADSSYAYVVCMYIIVKILMEVKTPILGSNNPQEPHIFHRRTQLTLISICLPAKLHLGILKTVTSER